MNVLSDLSIDLLYLLLFSLGPILKLNMALFIIICVAEALLIHTTQILRGG